MRVAAFVGMALGCVVAVTGAGVELGGDVGGAIVAVMRGICFVFEQACRKMILINPASPMKSSLHFRVRVEFSAMELFRKLFNEQKVSRFP